MSKLDDIMDSAYSYGAAGQTDPELRHKQQVIDLFLEIIGEDEIHMIHVKGGSTYDGYVEPKSFNAPDLTIRNTLRAELRTKAREL